MYIFWDEVKEEAVGIPASAPLGGAWLPCIMPPPRTSVLQAMAWSLVDGVVVGSWVGSDDPLDEPVDHAAISIMRSELEVKPIKINSKWFDFDLTSRSRFEGAITAWDELLAADITGMLFTADAKILWRTADNQFSEFGKAEFSALYETLLKTAATRAAKLYEKSLQLKQSPTATARDCLVENWPIELMPA